MERETAKFLNVASIYNLYGIPRTALAQLAEEGRLHPRVITTATGYIRLYSVQEIEAIITEAPTDCAF